MQTAPIEGCEVSPDMPNETKKSVLERIISAEQIRTIYSNVDDISASSGCCEHTSGSNTSCVVRVNMDGKVRVRLSDSTNQPRRRRK